MTTRDFHRHCHHHLCHIHLARTTEGNRLGEKNSRGVRYLEGLLTGELTVFRFLHICFSEKI